MLSNLYITLVLVILTTVNFVYADVWIPESEFTSYFDSNGYYTVVGAIKNTESEAVIPILTLTIHDGDNLISESFTYVRIMPFKDLPFKIKFPEVITANPILGKPEISYTTFPINETIDVHVIYDKSLVKHDDGHLTGRIINNGTTTATNIKVMALIHGADGVLLDVGQNIEMIDKMEPGEIRSFSMYPDPSINAKIWYYSCFAIGDTTIIPISTVRKNEEYDFRYDSVVWFAYAKFDESGKTLYMKTHNNWPFENYANFEFPRASDTEKLQVFLNNESIDFIQSIDEMGNWHVAFVMPGYTSGDIVITGFEDRGTVTPIEKISDIPKVTFDNKTQSSNEYYYLLSIIPAALIGIAIYQKKKYKN